MVNFLLKNQAKVNAKTKVGNSCTLSPLGRQRGCPPVSFPPVERLHTSSSGCSAGAHAHHQPAAAPRSSAQRAHQRESAQTLPLSFLEFTQNPRVSCIVQNGNSALSIARRLGYISVVDTLKAVCEETLTTQVCLSGGGGDSHRCPASSNVYTPPCVLVLRRR